MMTGRDEISIPPGTIVSGKWHGRRYQMIRRLGSGTQGTVYLVKAGNKKVAMKIAKNRGSLISEVNVLKRTGELQGQPLGPSLFDNDDWIVNNQIFSFCVMEYLDGVPLSEALRNKPFDWAVIYVIQLLSVLGRLHRAGYIFGDLKPENIILLSPGHTVRCLDFGGATRIGRSVREYTTFYDRGYWGYGTRKAEPSYDLFACTMMMIYAAEGRTFEKNGNREKQLVQIVRTNDKLARYRSILEKGLAGRYALAEEMRRDMLQKATEQESAPVLRRSHTSRSAVSRTGSERNGWFGAIVTASVIMAAYVLFVMVYIM
ncbi:hypothetical protein EWI07_13910 [Sporolactobacillus sp. THM7-4]|nr:hypothetical protein EWI07_13910 [Sporolactobacillus sp. THM7-4]